MTPLNTEVLDKVINKVPFFCRLGWHRWQAISVGFRYAGRKQIISRCRRCMQEKTEIT